MTPAEFLSDPIAETAQDLRDRQEPFAFATIVRTNGTTAAKPGAKAIIGADGAILHGFLGGGCTRGAVRRAALAAIESGGPKLISVAPEEHLAEQGKAAGEEEAGVLYARNGCPSRGTVDIFIEPCLPMPELVVLGGSPVAEALCQLAPQFHWSVAGEISSAVPARLRVIVVATQGQGDMDALTAALQAGTEHVFFVGSAKKYAALSAKLVAAGQEEGRVAAVHAPAGLNIGAVTPEEIALSILASLVQIRRAPVPRGEDRP
ncbi:XdhC family protein [Pacificoceanicola onchidii]|uniref:XdhC family protein n=1 Tax=Pacificoceanicola onchidii TaxID=2562685 RepID=UPI0010A627C6|nr:XdhC family protein [Pacificoceanicola onchidii]